MQPHEIPARFHGVSERRLLKVVDALSFARRDLMPAECAWLADSPDARVPDLPWGAVVTRQASDPDDGSPWGPVPDDTPDIASRSGPPQIRIADSAAMAPGDIIELLPGRHRVRTRYRHGANANTLFATERCNSYCLMCSQPPRRVDDEWRINDLLAVIALLDRDVPELGLSGGEPTLLGDGLIAILRACRERLPDTSLHVLSNGRRFGTTALADAVAALDHPRLTWGVPLYADVADVHDYVVQSAGAFDETLRGLQAMAGKGLRFEIRVVLTAPTIARLPALADFICRHLPAAVHVAFMGLEPIGFALANRDALWVDPADMAAPLTRAVHHLANRGMAISLYNLPLCVLPTALRPFARRSISDWKQRYLDVCDGCALRSRCAGFFEWVKPGWIPRDLHALNAVEVSQA
jgi:His-Xaa-Ser system radical SAM maturase HxsC